MGDSKEEVVTISLSEKKSSTKNVEKGNDKLADVLLVERKYSTMDVEKETDELADIKHTVNTICRKDLDQFEGQSIVTKG